MISKMASWFRYTELTQFAVHTVYMAILIISILAWVNQIFFYTTL